MIPRPAKCGRPATMRVYGPDPKDPGPGTTMCSAHGTMLTEDAGRTWSQLRPGDPPARCEFEGVS